MKAQETRILKPQNADLEALKKALIKKRLISDKEIKAERKKK